MKVFFAEFAVPFWFRVAEDLRTRYGIEPVAWTGVDRMREGFTRRFPEALFLDLADVKRNIFPPSLAHCQHAPLDAHCRRVWQDLAQLVYDQFHRWDRAGDFSTLERTEHFYEALVFWNGLLEHLKPDAIIFRNAPHAIYDIILLGLARSRGITTLMFHHTSIIPYTIITSDLDRGCNPFHEGLRMARWEREAGRQPAAASLTPVVQQQVDKMRMSYTDAVPWYQHSSIASLNSSWSWSRIRKTASRLWGNFRRDLVTYLFKRCSTTRSPVNDGSMSKEAGRLLRDSFLDPFATFRNEFSRIEQRRKTLKLRARYQSLTSDRNPFVEGPYVYVALGFQPEATTNPHGGIFAQQLLMVNSLANALPEGWQLVVREHPAQFNWDFVGYVCRNEEFYRLLTQMPRVHLASLMADPFRLMDNCHAVACLVGTTGWEGIVRGKPSIIFGDIWYDRCPGVFRVRSYEDCRAALQTIAAGFTAAPDLVHDYIKELEFSAVTAGGDLEVAPPGVPTSDAEITVMSDTMARIFGRPPVASPRIHLRALAT
jgi:hypothetical protein